MVIHRSLPVWLNPETRTHASEVIEALIARYYGRLLGIILFGSVARHEERPMRGKHPSDVDLFLIFDQDSELTLEERIDLFTLVGQIAQHHQDDLRDINFMFATRTLAEWDAYFIEQVAQDGIVLYAVPPLPTPLRALESV